MEEGGPGTSGRTWAPVCCSGADTATWAVTLSRRAEGTEPAAR